MDAESLLTELELCPPVSQWMIGHHAIILLIHVTNNVAIEETSNKKTQTCPEIDSGGLGFIFFSATALKPSRGQALCFTCTTQYELSFVHVQFFQFVAGWSEVFARIKFARFGCKHFAYGSCHSQTAVGVDVDFANS